MLPDQSSISLNRYFFIPLLIWAIEGALMIICIPKETLFYTINTNYTPWADVFFYHITIFGQGDVIIPALILLAILPRFRNWWYLLLATSCNLIPFFIQQGLKSLFDWPRPHLLYYDRLWMHYLPEWPNYLSRSFPSGHSAGAFSFFCFLALLLPPRYRGWGLLCFILGMLVCYSRVYLAAHFFADVYVGGLLGASLTAIIFYILTTGKKRFLSKSIT